jgi:hypothetical protein
MESPWGTAKNPQVMEAEYNHLNLITRPGHMLIATPPKHLENASHKFWARGYFVTIVGRD